MTDGEEKLIVWSESAKRTKRYPSDQWNSNYFQKNSVGHNRIYEYAPSLINVLVTTLPVIIWKLYLITNWMSTVDPHLLNIYSKCFVLKS